MVETVKWEREDRTVQVGLLEWDSTSGTAQVAWWWGWNGLRSAWGAAGLRTSPISLKRASAAAFSSSVELECLSHGNVPRL